MSKLIKSLPLEDNYLMPAEYSKHQATWIIWPERLDNWRAKALPAQKAFSELANQICKNEQVFMGVSKAQFENAKKLLDPKVILVNIENDDAWIRDSGPTIIKNKITNETRGISWIFNSWGGLVDGLYSPWDKDQQVAQKVCETMNLDYYQAPIILEGGSIHTDGKGTLYMTEACLLSAGRNSTLSKSEIENQLKNYLGIKKIIWLKNGIFNDETNEHIDNVMQVSETGAVLLHWCDDQQDPQYELSKSAYDLLTSSTDALGNPIKVIKIPAPDPLIYITKEESEGVLTFEGTLARSEGDQMAASYLNHYIGNGAVYIPKFNGKNDQIAYDLIASTYPSRKIIQIELAREIILGGGNIHCITQQIPKAFVK